MDNLRGRLSDGAQPYDDKREIDPGDDEIGRELPPAAIGQDERRMQVRAYNFWASMLDNRNFPSVDQLDPANLPDFGPYSVLLDFTGGIEDPGVNFLGGKLAEECGADGPIRHLSDVPRRSLLSRITDHYMQILANQAPIGFEAEFVNQRGSTILYRGILLPFAANDDKIDFIYGVINWKELADQQTTDELLLEIDQVLEAVPEAGRAQAPLTEWADGPVDESGVLELNTPLDPGEGLVEWPEPAFARETDHAAEQAPLPAMAAEREGGDDDQDESDAAMAAPHEEPAPARAELPGSPPAKVADPARADSEAPMMGLADWLASARALAEIARGSEDRSRQALYAAIGRAYDFALAAAAEPAQYQELLEEAGLVVQERAPFTPVVKLVFGLDYDKTRLAEFGAAIAHAHRLGLARGALAEHLAEAEGGLKGVVAGERRLRREESGKKIAPREEPRKTIQRKLRKLPHQPLLEVSSEGSEFTLLVARRLGSGEVVLLGEVGDDVQLLERAAKKLIG
jgi:hypothetical protein